MKSKLPIGMVLMGALLLLPMIAGAEVASTSASGSVRASGMLRESPTKGSVVSHEITSPRDTASGMATGKRLNGLPPGTPVTGTRALMGTGTRPLPPGMEKMMENRDDMHAKMMQNGSSTVGRGEEMRGKMMERRGEILKRIANQMITRMNAAIDRLATLADRIDSRIAKLKEKGIDTTKAEANIAIARTKIADAKAAVILAGSAIESAATQADASASSTKPVDPGKTVREALTKARTAVVAAHKAIVDAVESLKAGVGVEGDVHADKATGTPRTINHHGGTTTTSGVDGTN